MRFKKILAGITAGALALSSLSVALWATDNTATVKTMIMHPKTWATDKAASFESDVNEVVAINLKGYEDTIKKVRIEFVDITTDYIKPVLITNNWDADKTPQSVYDASYFSPTIKDGKATLDVEFGVTKEASDSGEGDVNGLSFASGYGTIEFKVNMNWMNAGSVSLSNITFFDANGNEVVQVEALTDTIPFSGTEADPYWSWTETTFVSSSSTEMTNVDVTGTDKIIFNAAAFDLGYGYNGAMFITANSDGSNYKSKSIGAENKKFGENGDQSPDIMLESTGKFSVEVPINITETGGFILKAGTDAKSGAFELVSIEFYKGDTKLGVWKNHEFVSSTVPVTGVTVLPNTISLKLGETQSLKETVVPETATDKTVTWSSDKENVATVDKDGNVTAKGIGEATITVASVAYPTITATCAVTVTSDIEALQLTQEKLSMKVGDPDVTLEVTRTPPAPKDTELVWESSNEAAATVDKNGVVHAVATGPTEITVTAKNNTAATAKCVVNVTNPATAIELPETLTVLEGVTVPFTSKITPENADERDKVTYASSDETIFTVKGNEITGVKEGKATLTASITGTELKDTCVVSVTKEAVAATAVKLDKETLTLEVDGTAILTATKEPADSTDSIVWSSSDEKIATVDQIGNVTAVAVGSAEITAKANDSAKAVCKVEVKAKTVPVASVTLDKTEATVEEGAAVELKATVNPENATDKTVTWKSSDETIATVDSTGKVTGVKAGKATITATAGTKSAECAVTVTAKAVAVSEITLDKTAETVEEGKTVQLTATVKPDDATDKTVTWKSSDEATAKVDSTGKVTGVKAGKATITATAGEKSAECAVTVTAKPEETQPTEPDNPTPGDTITVYELNADELKLLSDPKTTFTISYNSPNGWNDIGFGASLPDESWASASLPAKQGDGTLKVTVEDLIKSMKVKEEGDVTTLDGVTYCKVEGYNGTVFYSVKVEIPTEPDEPDKPIEGMTANLKLYTQGNDGAGWAWKDFGDDSIKTVTVSDDSEAVELKWTIAVDEKVDSADKFSAGGLQIAFDDPDCAYVGQKVNIYITEITLGGEKKDDITKEETSIVANWNNTGSEIMVNLSDISFENVGKEYSCKVKITPVSKAPDQPDQPGEDDTTTTTKAPTGFYTPDESTTTTPSDTTTAPDSGSTPATADTTELTNDDNGIKVEFAAGTVKEGAVLNVNKSGETATSATFDITLNLNGAAIQPDGTLTITINIPAGLAGAANYYVYRVETDGTYTDMLATLADGKLTFKTGHLSEYVISTVKLTDTGVVNGDDSSTASSAPVEDNGANTGNADNEPAGDNGGNGNTGSTGGNTDDKNVATGIVIAFIPAAAAAAAVVISKKRK